MEAIRNLVPEGLPMSLQVIGATLLLGIIYSYITTERPSPNFPLISVRGLSPRKSFGLHIREVVQEGLRQVGRVVMPTS